MFSIYPKKDYMYSKIIGVEKNYYIIKCLKICPLRGHILMARFARSSQDCARLGRAI